MVKSDPFFRWSRLRVVRFMIVRLNREIHAEVERGGVEFHDDSNRRKAWFADKRRVLDAYVEEGAILAMRSRARRLNSRRMAA